MMRRVILRCAAAVLLACAAFAWPLAAPAESAGAAAVKGRPGELPRSQESKAKKPPKGSPRPAMPIEPAPKHGSMKLGAKPATGTLGVPPTGKAPIGTPPTRRADDGGPPRPRD